MRRMYSEKELTDIIKVVFEEELESGALDDLVSDAVDAYLVEHPVDITALEGKDVELASLDATGLITGGEIVEKMSGYSFSTLETSLNLEIIYASACKNGNKLTLVIFGTYTKHSGDDNYGDLGTFAIPASVASKLYPYTIDGYDVLDAKMQDFYPSLSAVIQNPIRVLKYGNGVRFYLTNANNAVEETKYFFRIEQTFLLSDNLNPEE